MITTILIYLFSFVLQTIAAILPTFQIWPAVIIEGLQYITAAFAKLNFILPVQEWGVAMSFFINFSSAIVSAKLVLKTLNYFRGTGSGLDI